MFLPNDSIMLYSVVNTLLRDKYESLSDLCEDGDFPAERITVPLEKAGYVYSEKLNKFVEKQL